MIALGDKVRFTPTFVKEGRCENDDRVYAEVVYVHPFHEYFVAQWDRRGFTLRESFKFSQVGKGREVKLLGRK